MGRVRRKGRAPGAGAPFSLCSSLCSGEEAAPAPAPPAAPPPPPAAPPPPPLLGLLPSADGRRCLAPGVGLRATSRLLRPVDSGLGSSRLSKARATRVSSRPARGLLVWGSRPVWHTLGPTGQRAHRRAAARPRTLQGCVRGGVRWRGEIVW